MIGSFSSFPSHQYRSGKIVSRSPFESLILVHLHFAPRPQASLAVELPTYLIPTLLKLLTMIQTLEISYKFYVFICGLLFWIYCSSQHMATEF